MDNSLDLRQPGASVTVLVRFESSLGPIGSPPSATHSAIRSHKPSASALAASAPVYTELLSLEDPTVEYHAEDAPLYDPYGETYLDT